MQEYLSEHGEELVTLYDSGGNYLIHHICLMLEDKEVEIFKEVFKFLNSAILAKEKVSFPLLKSMIVGY